MNRPVLVRRCSVLAVLSAGLTAVAGGLVHATGASLACPDWPLCFGQYFPPLHPLSTGILFEHGHRVLAGLTGLLILCLAAGVLASRRTTTAQRTLGVGAFVLVLVQALVGAATVLMGLPRWVSVTHFTLAQLTLLTVLTLSWSLYRPAHEGEGTPYTTWDRGVVLAGLLVTFGQMELGAWLRHLGTRGQMVSGFWASSLGEVVPCGTYPLCPPRWLNGMLDFYRAVYVSHRASAVLVLLVVVLVMVRFHRHRHRSRACYTLGVLAVGLVFVQVLVGELSVRSYLAPVPVTLHLAGAELLLLTLTLMYLRVRRPAWLAPRGRG